MAKFLLPSFTGDGGQPAPSGKRGWDVLSIADLEKVSSALHVPGGLSPNTFVDAIPDIWSKALLFAYSLQDTRHALHQRSVDAFRGFLAMLALREVRKYNIVVEKVDLDAHRSLAFGEAVFKLLPTKTLSNNTGWDPAYLFLLGREVVGICSPLTLFAPREGADMPTAAARGLTNGFTFNDPTSSLSTKECAALRDWLSSLETDLIRSAQQVGTWRSVVTDRIKEFKTVLTEKSDSIAPQAVQFAQGVSPIASPLFSHLGKALQLPTMPGGTANKGFELKVRDGAGDHLLVIDEGMIQGLPANTEILDGITAAVLKNVPLGDNSQNLGLHKLPPMWRWIRRDYFFLSRLTVVETQDAFVDIGNIPVKGARATETPIPPLKEEIAKYLPASWVMEHCWFDRTASEIVFKMQLPMSDGSELELTKPFKFTELNRVYLYDMPVAEIWPSRKLPDWKYFYTFWDRHETKSSFYLRPCGVETVNDAPTVDFAANEEVTVTVGPPEYLCCSEMKSSSLGLRLEPLGLVMPKYRHASASDGGNLMVGFDFGTTSTNIFATKQGQKPAALVFSPETLRIFKNEDPLRQGLMYRYFLPPNDESAPFLSLLRRRIPRKGALEPIRDAHVLFYNRVVESDQFADQNIESYLKWDSRLNDHRTAFLSQLVMHAAYAARLQGAQDLQFIYSYPTAFDNSTKQLLDSFWSGVPKMSSDFGLKCQSPTQQTESIATAHYFNNLPSGERALLGQGALILDIGGGTTDISVWLKNKLKIQTSVRLSGREILLTPMWEKKDFVVDMLAGCMTNGEAIFGPLKPLTEERFYRRADAILRTHGGELSKRLAALMNTNEFERFRSEIAIRVSALLYYAGMLLRGVGWLETGAELPDIYVGGNGSRVFNWLAPPEYQDNQFVNKLLKRAFAAGAGLSQATLPRLILSREPKSEVASGLVYSLEKILAQPDDAIQTIAGEEFDSCGTARKQTDSLTAELLKSGITVKGAAELETLLNLYNDFANRPGEILRAIKNVPAVVDRAKKEINDRAFELTVRNMKDISVEPLFVTGAVHAFPLIEWL